jgi:hypothetical protein
MEPLGGGTLLLVLVLLGALAWWRTILRLLAGLLAIALLLGLAQMAAVVAQLSG